jgi:hypothetical protein
MAKEPAEAQTVSAVIGPAEAIGERNIVRSKVAVAGVHTPLSATVIVRVMTPPVVVSLAPKE